MDCARASIARDVVRERAELGLSQRDPARLAGVRVETLCRIETGKHTASTATLAKLDRALARRSPAVRCVLVSEGVGQAKHYATKLAVRFTYATNGLGIYGIDMANGHEADVAKYPTPEELWNRTFEQQNEWRDRFAKVTLLVGDPGLGKSTLERVQVPRARSRQVEA